MKGILKNNPVVMASVMAVTMLFAASSVLAEEVKIAVLNMQKVLVSSEMGKKAQQEMEAKMKEIQQSFKKDEEALVALQEEIEKKRSVWSEEKLQDKTIEFQKMRRDLRVKQDDAKLEFNQLQEKKLAPIFKELEAVVEAYAKNNGITVIFPKETILYAKDGVDITDEVTKSLNAKSK